MTPLSKNRYIEKAVLLDLKAKMVFVGGPRQVGKTTFARRLLGAVEGEEHPSYLNWDIPAHRARILRSEFAFEGDLVVLDEIHKFARWRNIMKGFYDRFYPKRHALVTGSARLDYYRRGGDSLQGRYRYYRLHPYSLRELSSAPAASDAEALMMFGGFPEPLAAGDETTWRRWQRDRLSRVLGDDLRSLERVHELSLLELLLEALPARVGSPLSIKSLCDLLQVSHEAVRRWLEIFERLYLTFRIAPYGADRIRAVRKEQKLYLWDWTQVENRGARFENMVASHLLKYCHFVEDTEGRRMELRYLRDIDKREADFVVIRDRRALFAVECKTGETCVSPAARYFRQRTPIPRFYQTHLGTRDFGDAEKDVRVLPFATFVRELELP
jgi:predicted AAA+ superfamily ATPase